MCRLLCTMSVALALAGEVSRAADVDIPFVYTDGLIRLEVRARGEERPLWFLLDSGAAVSVINSSAAQRLGLRDGREVSVKGVGGGATGRWPQKLKASVGNVELPSRYLVVNLAEFEATCAFPVDGLIGAEFFEDRVVEIDFRSQRIRLMRGAERSRVDTLSSSIPLTRSRGAWTVKAEVDRNGGQRLRLDTGCATGLHWVASGAPDTAPLQHSVGLAAMVTKSAFCQIRLGGNELSDVPAALHTRRLFAGEDGLLGNEFLSRFGAVTLDGRSKRLILGAMTAH